MRLSFVAILEDLAIAGCLWWIVFGASMSVVTFWEYLPLGTCVRESSMTSPPNFDIPTCEAPIANGLLYGAGAVIGLLAGLPVIAIYEGGFGGVLGVIYLILLLICTIAIPLRVGHWLCQWLVPDPAG